MVHSGESEHVLLSYFSSRAIRRLVIASSETKQSSNALTGFPQLLWQAAFQGKCQQWLGTHAEKVLAALATCQDRKVTAALDAELRPLLSKSVKQWAAEFVQHGTETSKATQERKRLKQKAKRQKDRLKGAQVA